MQIEKYHGMNNRKKRINKGLIVLNKGERIAVITLLSIITVFLGISVFRPEIRISKKESIAFHNLDSLIAIHEQAKQALAQPMDNETVTPEQEKQQTVLSKPKTVQTTKPSPKTTPRTGKPAPAPIPILDINVADSTALIALPQIGEVMASRIHRYRNRLGGFVAMEQLFEIKGMDAARYETIKPYIVLENNTIQKINVNQDEFKTLLRHPYLEYEQVKAIVNHRERKGFIKDWEQLQTITGEVNPLLEAYVCY